MDHFTKAARDAELVRLLEAAVRNVRAAEGSLLLLDLDGTRLRFVIVCSPVADKLRDQEVPIGQSITGLAVSLQQPMIVNHVQRSEAFYAATDAATGTRTESLIAVPLATPAQEFGAITAINSAQPEGFTQRDLAAYQEAAQRISERLTSLDLGMENAGAAG